MKKQTLNVIIIVVFMCVAAILLHQFMSVAETATSSVQVYIIKPITSQKILPDTSPSSFPLAGKPTDNVIKVSACKGEYEPASLVLRSSVSSLEGVLLEPTDLKGSSGMIGRNNIDIRTVKVWYQAGTAWYDIRSNPNAVLVPELLLHDDSIIRVDTQTQSNYLKLSYPEGIKYQDISTRIHSSERSVIHDIKEFPVRDSKAFLPVDIPAKSNKQFWITIFVPPDTIPGTYFGKIFIKSRS